MMTFDFPVGYHTLNKTKIIDFQLNRWYSLGYCRLEDMAESGKRISSLDDWKDEMVRQAERALGEGRLMNGTFHIRAAEFFTHPDDPDKLGLYDRFNELFYNQLCVDEPFERFEVPYEDGYLPALRLPALPDVPLRDTIVMHGGFDSFIEEFYSMATYFAARGHEVVMFEGPGQGGAIRRFGLPLILEWEKPTGAILDFFGLEDVTLLGISMGGWLCFRAAAFEPRISRVIASSIAFDYMQIPPKPVADFARWLMGHRRLMNRMSEWKMRAMPQENWGVINMMYITRTPTPLDGSLLMMQFNEENQHPDLVTQDVLILTGADDHFIPLKMHDLQMASLTNARSLTGRIFTAEEQASNHCQVGNIGLAVKVMMDWVASKSEQPSEVTP